MQFMTANKYLAVCRPFLAGSMAHYSAREKKDVGAHSPSLPLQGTLVSVEEASVRQDQEEMQLPTEYARRTGATSCYWDADVELVLLDAASRFLTDPYGSVYDDSSLDI